LGLGQEARQLRGPLGLFPRPAQQLLLARPVLERIDVAEPHTPPFLASRGRPGACSLLTEHRPICIMGKNSEQGVYWGGAKVCAQSGRGPFGTRKQGVRRGPPSPRGRPLAPWPRPAGENSASRSSASRTWSGAPSRTCG